MRVLDDPPCQAVLEAAALHGLELAVFLQAFVLGPEGVDQALEAGPGSTYCSPRHRMPFNSTNKGSKCVSITSRAILRLAPSAGAEDGSEAWKAGAGLCLSVVGNMAWRATSARPYLELLALRAQHATRLGELLDPAAAPLAGVHQAHEPLIVAPQPDVLVLQLPHLAGGLLRTSTRPRLKHDLP